MTNSRIAYYANLILKTYGYKAEPTKFWKAYPYVCFEGIELRIDAETTHSFDGILITSHKHCDMTFEFYITSECKYIIYLNLDDNRLEAFVVIAKSQDDVMRFLSDFDEAIAEIAAIA